LATAPTIYIIASDANRNGKTLLARLVVDYLLLDGKDPFAIDTDAPDGPLRTFFPGRTALAEFDKTQGQMRLFDTVMASPGRDYVIDLPQRHMLPFFTAVDQLDFFKAAKAAGFRIIVLFIVDRVIASLRAARTIYDVPGVDLFVAVKNEQVGTSWPADEGALIMPALPRTVAIAISDRRFSLRNFVLGDDQGLAEKDHPALNHFLLAVLEGLSNIDTEITLARLRK